MRADTVVVALSGILALLCALSPGFVPKTAWAGDPVPAPAKTSRANAELLAATSPFEDLTEYALQGDVGGMRQALKKYDRENVKIRKYLPAEVKSRLASLVHAIRQAQQQGKYAVVALKSVEAYRTLLEALDAGSLTVPLQVSLLDYAGFKLLALLHVPDPDWAAVRATTTEAGRQWRDIAPTIQDASLRDAMNTVLKGLNQGATEKNTGMVALAAQVDLDLVDLLERYYAKQASGPAAKPAPKARSR